MFKNYKIIKPKRNLIVLEYITVTIAFIITTYNYYFFNNLKWISPPQNLKDLPNHSSLLSRVKPKALSPNVL
jgi:hypothetical protein